MVSFFSPEEKHLQGIGGLLVFWGFFEFLTKISGYLLQGQTLF